MLSDQASSEFRSAVMQDSASDATSLVNELFPEIKGGDKLKLLGFFTLVIQDLKVVSMRPYRGPDDFDGGGLGKRKQGYVYVSSGTPPKKFHTAIRWGKDCYGLLTKTPGPAVFASLPPAIRRQVIAYKEDLSKKLLALFANHWKRAGRKIAKAFLNDPGSACFDFSCDDPFDTSEDDPMTLDDYFEILFTESPYSKDHKASAESSWASFIHDATSTPIVYPKPDKGLISENLRVAFEYRQLSGGNLREAIRIIAAYPDLPKGNHEEGCTKDAAAIQKKLQVLCAKPGTNVKGSFKAWASKCMPHVTKKILTDLKCSKLWSSPK